MALELDDILLGVGGKVLGGRGVQDFLKVTLIQRLAGHPSARDE